VTAPTLTDLKFYIITPSAATNYVTNPTPYKATTNYAAYDAGSGTTIAASDTYTRRGPKCIKVSAAAAEAGGIYFGDVSIVDGTNYVFSVDVKGVDGEAMRIQVEDHATPGSGAYQYTETFTATGYWQRIELAFTGEEDASDYKLFVIRDSQAAATDFYVDGFQLEDGVTEATTFFSGDSVGFGFAQQEFYWGGTPHASVSYRTADTRAGGALLDLDDYCELAGLYGLGMGGFSQAFSEIVSGGAIYQGCVRKPRNFVIKVHYTGSMSTIQDNRNAIIEAIRPDYTGYDQPLIVRYQGEDSDGDEATEPLDIVCIPQTSHVDPPPGCAFNEDTLTFTVLGCWLRGAYTEGNELDFSQTESNETAAFYLDTSGGWNGVIAGSDGILDDAWCLAEGVDGKIYIGGTFTNAGTVAEADYLCDWDGSAIDDVTGSADFGAEVRAIAVDAAGNLYIGGDFVNAGDASGDRIVKCTSAGVLSSLGSGANGDVHAIAIDPDTGYVYIGGAFTAVGGVANTARIAYWDGSAWKALSTGISNGIVYTLAFSPGGNLYIGGTFTNIDGSNGDYIGYWDGSSFNRIGWSELNAYVKTIKFGPSGTLYAGGNFTNAGGWFANADRIAKWSGWYWSALGSGLDGVVHAIEIIDGVVYAGGEFTGILKKYSSGSWTTVNLDLDGTPVVYDIMEASDGKIYVATTDSGTTSYAASDTVTNSGNTLAYPIITVVGPGQLTNLTNATTGKSLSFTDLTLQSGETITLNMNPENLRFTSSWSGRGNVLSYANPSSNLGSFYLKSGSNTITCFMASGTDANTKIFIELTPMFWNIEGSRLE
jgi:hypothetical protein